MPLFLMLLRMAFRHVYLLFPLHASAAVHHHHILHCTCSTRSMLTQHNQQDMAEDYISSSLPEASTSHLHQDESGHFG
jgi:hypothetical protein